MRWEYLPYISMLFIAALVAAALTLFAWRNRSVPGAVPFTAFMLGVTIWAGAYGVELLYTDLETKFLWAKIAYIGIVTVPPSGLIFAIRISGHEEWLSRRNILLVAMMPAVTLTLTWTNELHHLIWSDVQLLNDQLAGWELNHGPAFWVWTVHSYVLIGISLHLLVQHFRRSSGPYRLQAAVLLIGAILPWSANILTLARLNPFPGLDLTPFAFTLSGVALNWGLFRYQLLDLMPVAREIVVESMSDAVIVLDGQHRIVDLNPGAQRVIDRPAKDVIGLPVGEILPPLLDPLERHTLVEKARTEIVLEIQRMEHHYEVFFSPIYNQREQLTGRLVVLHDITERKLVEQELRRAHDELEQRVAERTTELSRANLSLREEIAERRQAEEVLRRYTERLRALRAIDGAILGAWSAEEVARATLRHIQQLVPCQWASVAIFDSGTPQAMRISMRMDGRKDEEEEELEFFPHDFGDLERLRWGKLHLVHDLAGQEERTPVEEALYERGIRSFLMIPLITRGKLIGAFNLGAQVPNAFRGEQVTIARELADQLAIATQQARLHEQVQRYAAELEQRVAERTRDLERRTVQLQVAAEVARDATTARDLGDLLNRAVDLIRERFGFYHAAIFLVDRQGERVVLRAASGEAGQRLLKQGYELRVDTDGLVGDVIATGRPRIASGEENDTPPVPSSPLPHTRSEMTLPLKVDERVIGALDVQSLQEAAFGEDDMAVLQTMADQLAVTIEKVRLFEQAQAALEERLRTVVSNTPIILFALDEKGIFTLSEGNGLRSLGLTPGEVVGQSIFEVFDGSPHLLQNFQRALSGEEFVVIEEINGLSFEALYSPLREPNGEVSGIIGIGTDITERRRLEEQMRQQDRMAAIGQLAGGIAHDFNNILTTIMLYAQMAMRRSDLPEGTHSALDTILDESRQAAALVEQILDFSRRSAIEVRPVDLRSTIKETLEILRRTLPENIQLVMEAGANRYVVNADPARLQQALMNLALNARDAMPDGGELRIQLSHLIVPPGEDPPLVEMTAGDWVCLGVSDTGTGMPPEVMAHLFEPFFTTKPPGKGTGLGLAQVYGIVKQHMGHIGVETEVGQGTVFSVYLPAYLDEEVEETAPAEETPLPMGLGESILLVEDEEGMREVAREILETLGYRVLTAANGRAALEVYHTEGGVDLLLTDVIMPEMGGRELVRRLRQEHPQLKVLAITGYLLAEDLESLRQDGILDVLHKPFEVNSLAQVVRRALDA